MWKDRLEDINTEASAGFGRRLDVVVTALAQAGTVTQRASLQPAAGRAGHVTTFDDRCSVLSALTASIALGLGGGAFRLVLMASTAR